MPMLLVVDDEESVRYSFRYVFEENDVQVVTAATAAEGLEAFRDRSPDVVVLDLQLPDLSGLELFREIQQQDRKRPVIVITAHGTTETAIEAMKLGAFDYLVKPIDLDRFSQILERAFEAARLMHVPALLAAEVSSDHIIGRSTVIQDMCKAIGRIAPQDVNVLILGASGTGKELVARALYHHSRRCDRPFLAINCAAIPETLLESELFGHEQGAFTGAQRRRIGKFEQCDGGTLFLDEIGDLAPPLQGKMLRVLQEQRFERLGGNESVQTNVRVLAATNHDLDKCVQQGSFRADLYYRLKGVTIEAPPLAARLDDIPELAHHFLFRFNRELDMDLRGIDPAALSLLQSYSWPGNVRELQSVLREAMFRATGHIIVPEFLPAKLQRKTAVEPAPTAVDTDLLSQIEKLLQEGETRLYDRAVEALDRHLLLRVLRATHGHQTQAAERLGMSRGTLRQKLKHLGFAIDKVLSDDAEREGTPLPRAKE
jgi:two-component system nitrogen regulation response regulator GlnG